MIGKENPVHSRNFPTAVVESPSQMDHNAWTASLSRAADSKEAIHSFFSRMELPLPDMNLQRLRLQVAPTFSRNFGFIRLTSGL